MAADGESAGDERDRLTTLRHPQRPEEVHQVEQPAGRRTKARRGKVSLTCISYIYTRIHIYAIEHKYIILCIQNLHI